MIMCGGHANGHFLTSEQPAGWQSPFSTHAQIIILLFRLSSELCDRIIGYSLHIYKCMALLAGNQFVVAGYYILYITVTLV